jgi:SRSO17 transposase
MGAEHWAQPAWAPPDADALVLEECATVLDRLYERLAHRFGRVEVRARVRRYLAGLLQRLDRKNSWQVAEAIGEAGPQGLQRLLTTAVWDAEAVRDDLRAYVVEQLGDAASGVLIVDETGFLKKGTHSCGVAPQYCGPAGRTANCQVGVFLGYASARGIAFLDRALYLPQAWAHDAVRRAETGVPKDVRFATKSALAQRMLARAFAAAVPARWVVADSLYGRGHRFRRWLEQQEQAYVMGILPAQVVEYQGQRQRASALAAHLPAGAWVRRSAGEGSQGPRIHDWACVCLSEPASVGMARWLLVRRSLEDPCAQDDFRAYGPVGTPEDALVRVAGMRWASEEGFGQSKGEVGLDQYEVRGWQAWHRQITLCLLVHAALAVLCLTARRAEERAKRGGLRAGQHSSR